MEFFDVMRGRFSVRSYQAKPRERHALTDLRTRWRYTEDLLPLEMAWRRRAFMPEISSFSIIR